MGIREWMSARKWLRGTRQATTQCRATFLNDSRRMLRNLEEIETNTTDKKNKFNMPIALHLRWRSSTLVSPTRVLPIRNTLRRCGKTSMILNYIEEIGWFWRIKRENSRNETCFRKKGRGNSWGRAKDKEIGISTFKDRRKTWTKWATCCAKSTTK